jgi:gamma-glutamyltranspeptidase/glutathione hydrolase
MTSSIETAFGSRLMTGGFILNNQLTDFSFAPRDANQALIANRVEGGKRPRSSMSPMIVFDRNDKPVLIIGSPGGKKIIGYVARTLFEVLAFDRPLMDAIASPHHMGSRLEVESTIDESFVQALQAYGHQPVKKPQTSGLHAIMLQDDGWLGVADPRREGTAQGR